MGFRPLRGPNEHNFGISIHNLWDKRRRNFPDCTARQPVFGRLEGIFSANLMIGSRRKSRRADPESRRRIAKPIARKAFGQFREDLGPMWRDRPVPRMGTFDLRGQPCRIAAIWFNKLRIKHDASPTNCESIPKFCNRKVVGFQCQGVPEIATSRQTPFASRAL